MRPVAILLTIALGPINVLAQVTPQRLAGADKEPSNWLTYSGNYQSHRFSPLNQITRENVSRLKPASTTRPSEEMRCTTLTRPQNR